MIFQDLNNQISSMRSMVDSIRLDIEKEKTRLHQLYQKSAFVETINIMITLVNQRPPYWLVYTTIPMIKCIPTATNRRKAVSLSILSIGWIHYVIQVSNKYS